MDRSGVLIQVESTTIQIADPVTGEQYTIQTDRPTDPSPTDDSLGPPVSHTFRIYIKSLVIDAPAMTYLR